MAKYTAETDLDYTVNPKLYEQDFIGLPVYDYRAVSFNHALETGVIGGQASGVADTKFDLDADDSFSEKMKSLREDVMADMRDDPLRRKDNWTYADRMQWEERLSQSVSENTSKIKGFDSFRDGTKGTMDLNLLSKDIDADTKVYEFDCEQMSMVEGLTMQMVENDLLPDKAAPGDYKHESNYYYMSGARFDNSEQTEATFHSFVMSSATGGINESTAEGKESAYRRPTENHSFEKFVAGESQVYEFDKGRQLGLQLYNGGYAPDNDTGIRKRIDAIKSGKFESLGNEEMKTAGIQDIGQAMIDGEPSKINTKLSEGTYEKAIDRIRKGEKPTAQVNPEAATENESVLVAQDNDSVERPLSDRPAYNEQDVVRVDAATAATDPVKNTALLDGLLGGEGLDGFMGFMEAILAMIFGEEETAKMMGKDEPEEIAAEAVDPKANTPEAKALVEDLSKGVEDKNPEGMLATVKDFLSEQAEKLGIDAEEQAGIIATVEEGVSALGEVVETVWSPLAKLTGEMFQMAVNPEKLPSLEEKVSVRSDNEGKLSGPGSPYEHASCGYDTVEVDGTKLIEPQVSPDAEVFAPDNDPVNRGALPTVETGMV